MGMTLCESCPRLYLRFGGVNCNTWRDDADDGSVSVILERLRSWLQIRVNMPVNNKASVIEKPFIHSFTNNKQCLNDEARSYNLSLKFNRCQSGLVLVNYPRVQKNNIP